MLLYEVANPVKNQTMFSVDRITRQGDRFLERLRMDAETLRSLRQDNVGLLFEKFLSLETMLGRITPLADKVKFGRTAIVYSSATAGAHIYQLLCGDGLCRHQKKTSRYMGDRFSGFYISREFGQFGPAAEWTVGIDSYTSRFNLHGLNRQNPKTL